MSVGKDELRGLIFNNLEIVKELLLTKNDLSLLEFIKIKNEVRPIHIAEFKNANVNNASTKLKRLFSQGYLQRQEISNETGGKEYLYSLAECIK